MARKVTIAVQEHRFTAVFEPAEEGGYTVTVPALPGVVTEGDNFEEARAMAADAIRGYLELLREDGLPIPVDGRDPPVEPTGKTARMRRSTA